jgi:hypothetical protein
MLLMVRLSNVSHVAYRAYVLAYVVVFIGMMQVVNSIAFLGLSPKDLLTHPAQAVRSFVNQQRSEFASRDHTYLAALDKYPAIGLPFATYGQDNAAEDYLFAHRKVDPEFYVAVVGVYTEAELSRKLADTFRHEYLLVKKGWEQPWPEHGREDYLWNLRKWFLYPVDLRWLRPDLDPLSSVNRFIAEHYRAVEEIGPCLVLHRFDANQPTSDKLDKR